MVTDVLEKELDAVVVEIGGAGAVMRHDVSSEDDWAAVVAATMEAFGRLDVLINNAAIYRVGPIEEERLDDFNKLLVGESGRYVPRHPRPSSRPCAAVAVDRS